jgi:hypothetical protein
MIPSRRGCCSKNSGAKSPASVSRNPDSALQIMIPKIIGTQKTAEPKAPLSGIA